MDTSKRKPDLMAGASTSLTHKRILAQLEHGARPVAHPARAAGWTIDGWTISLFVLLLLMCCVAWMMHDKTITPKTYRPSYSSRSATPAVQAGAPEPAQAAAIVNMAQAEIVDDDEEMSASGATASTATGAMGAMRSMASAETTAAVRARGAVSDMPAALSARAIAAQHKSQALAARTASQPAQAANPAPSAAHGGDTDVALLTALVAHAGKPAAVTPERSRDIVERQDGDTTLQLLARCKQLGLIEGMLCRSRICSGRWESDAACRAPSH